MTCGEQVAWLDAMQSISMAMGGAPLAVLGRSCNRGVWKPEYDGEKLHVSRPQYLEPVREVEGVLTCKRSDMQIV